MKQQRTCSSNELHLEAIVEEALDIPSSPMELVDFSNTDAESSYVRQESEEGLLGAEQEDYISDEKNDAPDDDCCSWQKNRYKHFYLPLHIFRLKKDMLTPSSNFFTLIFKIYGSVWRGLAEQTNKFAEQRLHIPVTNNPRATKWAETNSEEMKRFVGIIDCIGLNPLPRTNLFW